MHLLKSRFAFSQPESNKLATEIQKTVEKASMWLWMKRNDPNWNEGSTSNQNVNTIRRHKSYQFDDKVAMYLEKLKTFIKIQI